MSLVLFQIFVEVERARLIRKEVEILEAEGKIDEAAFLIQEVQVRENNGVGLGFRV